MKISITRKAFNPHFRVAEARKLLANPNHPTEDIWVRKLANMYGLRALFKAEYKDEFDAYFEDQYPLYADLLNAFEDTRVGGDRDLLEACILASNNSMDISKALDNPRFTPEYLSLYRQLFYCIDRDSVDDCTLFQYVISPLLKENGSKLATGSIWKLLALTGGLPVLVKKGLGTSAIRIEDVEYLMQLTCMRHLATMLQYASEGISLFEDNPAAAATLNTLSEFDGLRGSGRRRDYIANITDVSKNRFSAVLAGELKLISAPGEVLAKLVELDGTFSPAEPTALEVTKHLTFIEDTENDK